MMNSFQKMSEKILLYQDIISQRNYVNIRKFTTGGMLLTGGVSLAALLSGGQLSFAAEYCACFAVFVLSYLFTRFILVKNVKHTAIAFYCMLLPIYAAGILMGTFLDPESSAITIYILLCTLTMFITDKPQRLLGFLFAIAIVFLLCSYLCKEPNIFVADLVNLLIYFSIGLGVNILTLSDRVDSAENYALAKDRADQDVLTAVMNRGAGERTVLQLLEQKRTGSFFMVDIDDFKFFNDTYGHKVGDEVICAVSGQLKKEFRKFDVVFRLGGDEFAVFATDLVDRAACKKHITNIQTALQRVTTANERSFEIKVSIGCTICGSTECTFEKLYKSSDDALYKAKNNGKNCFYIQEIMQ